VSGGIDTIVSSGGIDTIVSSGGIDIILSSGGFGPATLAWRRLGWWPALTVATWAVAISPALAAVSRAKGVAIE
jgi:hypothetical protein